MSHHPPVPAGLQTGSDDHLPLPQALSGSSGRPFIRYGAIELVIHDGRVVQLERHEKVRFE
jgi:Uncharacterized small protein (DUF2292)